MNDVFDRYQLDDQKYYRLNTLYFIMNDMGVVSMNRTSFTTDWMRWKMQSGELTLPMKRKHAVWRFSGKTIKDIVRAFVPGGKGSYVYQD